MLVKGNDVLLKDIRSILLIQLGDIGDVVLSLPSIRALRESYPHSNLIVAVREKAKELIEDSPWATGVISINKEKAGFIRILNRQWGFFSYLRRFHFDLAIDLRTGSRGAILAFLSGAGRRIGFYACDGKLWRNRLFTHLAYLEGKPGQHLADYYLNLLLAYNLKAKSIWPEMQIPREKQERAAALFKKEKIPSGRPVITIQPFSLWQYKEWGKDKYIQVVKQIRDEYDLPVIIAGSPEEKDRADEITRMGGKNVFNFAGKTSIGMFAAVLQASGLFIGGDSAGMHIAAAVGTPTVCIFGPSSSVAWGPRGKHHTIVYSNLSCVPCDEKGCQGSEVSQCLEDLTVAEVMEAVKRQVDKILAGKVNS